MYGFWHKLVGTRLNLGLILVLSFERIKSHSILYSGGLSNDSYRDKFICILRWTNASSRSAGGDRRPTFRSFRQSAVLGTLCVISRLRWATARQKLQFSLSLHRVAATPQVAHLIIINKRITPRLASHASAHFVNNAFREFPLFLCGNTFLRDSFCLLLRFACSFFFFVVTLLDEPFDEWWCCITAWGQPFCLPSWFSIHSTNGGSVSHKSHQYSIIY